MHQMHPQQRNQTIISYFLNESRTDHLFADYEVFYGTASPPTSYGGYGGNAKEAAKYTFEYPAGWKSAAPNKVEKGTQGIDCRVYNVRLMCAISNCCMHIIFLYDPSP